MTPEKKMSLEPAKIKMSPGKSSIIESLKKIISSRKAGKEAENMVIGSNEKDKVKSHEHEVLSPI